jgi:hypothetical protein
MKRQPKQDSQDRIAKEIQTGKLWPEPEDKEANANAM